MNITPRVSEYGNCEYCKWPFVKGQKGLPQRFCSAKCQMAAWKKRKRQAQSAAQLQQPKSTLLPLERTREHLVLYSIDDTGRKTKEFIWKWRFEQKSIEEQQQILAQGYRWMGKCAYNECKVTWELEPDPEQRIKQYCCHNHRMAYKREVISRKRDSENMQAIMDAQKFTSIEPEPYVSGPQLNLDDWNDIIKK